MPANLLARVLEPTLLNSVMGTFRQAAAMLFVAMLALASIDRAKAAVLLPEMEALLDAETRPEAVSKRSANLVSESDKSGEPLPSGLRVAPQSPASSTTSPSVATGTVIGGAALATWTITLVGGSLSDTLESEPRCGWDQLHRTGVFRPPRRAA